LRSFGNECGTASLPILKSFGVLFGMDQAHLTCHLSGAFTGLLDVCHMLGELIVFDRGVHVLALLSGACRFICRCVYHHLTQLTYCCSLSPLVDSYFGALPAASLLNW